VLPSFVDLQPFEHNEKNRPATKETHALNGNNQPICSKLASYEPLGEAEFMAAARQRADNNNAQLIIKDGPMICRDVVIKVMLKVA
jgi:hypothetical protein